MATTTINKVILVGNLTRDTHTDKLPTGVFVCNATVATNNDKDKPQFTDIVLWNKSAELFSEMAKKGSRVYIEGHLNTYTDGSVQRTEVIVTEFVILDRLESITAKFIEDSISKDKQL